MTDDIRESLHSESENYDVFCHRCQRVHRHFTFTREDYDTIMDRNVKLLQQAIDDEILREVTEHLTFPNRPLFPRKTAVFR